MDTDLNLVPLLLILTVAYAFAMLMMGATPKNLSECGVYMLGGGFVALFGSLMVFPFNPIDALLLKNANFLQAFGVSLGYAFLLVGLLSSLRFLTIHLAGGKRPASKRRAG